MLGVLALALALALGDDELLLLLLHAAARRPRTATPDVMTNFLEISFKETTLFSELSLCLEPATDRMARRDAALRALCSDSRTGHVNGS